MANGFFFGIRRLFAASAKGGKAGKYYFESAACDDEASQNMVPSVTPDAHRARLAEIDRELDHLDRALGHYQQDSQRPERERSDDRNTVDRVVHIQNYRKVF